MIKYTFKKALPVWEKDKENEMNYNLVFRAVVDKSDDAKIALYCSSVLSVNELITFKENLLNHLENCDHPR